MEPIAREEDDFISHMPDNVVTNIMDRLPLQDAVRTGVLSKTWRLKWTLLSQLVFDEEFFSYLSNTNAEDNQVRVIIGIKDLTILLFESRTFKLPTHFFSCLELKHLELGNCFVYPPPNFHGFPNLLSLDLHSVNEESSDYCELITRCPLLEILILSYHVSCKVNLAEIAKLENLKILSLYLCDLDTSSTTFELLSSLPKLQELELVFVLWNEIDRFSAVFPSLKVLKLPRICLDDGKELSCALDLIRSCPNLQTLEITAGYRHACHCSQIDYNTTGQLQLRSVMFRSLKGSENAMFLLKYILACSPFLKKIVIQPLNSMKSREKLKFAMKLLKLHRASPNVDVDVDFN